MEDLISRQAAIDEIRRCRFVVDAIEKINGLPSAQPEPITVDIDHELTQDEYVKLFKDMASAPTVLLPSAQPKKGKWEMKPDPFGFFHDVPVCSECGCMTTFREKTLYCPNCGAKMETDHE